MRPQKQGLKFFFFLVFLMAFGFSYVFKNFIEPYIFLNLSSILGFLGILLIIGILIELGKNFIIRFVGHKYFHNIDDIIDLSFATALGFTFYENIHTFIPLFINNISFDIPISLLKEIIFQSFYVLPIHMFCSGVFGFYYGMAHFALPELHKPYWYILKGTIISSSFYGLFFSLKSLDWRVNDVLNFFGYPSFSMNESFFPVIGFVFSTFGIMYLFTLIESQYEISETKEDQEKRKSLSS